MSVVRFPDDCVPKGAPVHTFNELESSATPEAVWRWLVRADRWPEIYRNCKDVVIDGGARELTHGTSFHWTTFGVRVHTVIEDLEVGRRLAWRGRGTGGTGYHGWVIEPTATGCRIVTEETQRGWLPWLARWYVRGALLKQHQRWLEGLSQAALTAPPRE